MEVGVGPEGNQGRAGVMGMPHASGGGSLREYWAEAQAECAPREWGWVLRVGLFAVNYCVRPTRVGVGPR